MKRIFACLFLFFLLSPPPAYSQLCQRMHSCPPTDGSYVCGDKGFCSKCPDNQFCKGGDSLKKQKPTSPPAPAIKVQTKKGSALVPLSSTASREKAQKKRRDWKPFPSFKNDEKSSDTFTHNYIICANEDTLGFYHRSQDLEVSQENFFCKGDLIAVPWDEWHCKGSENWLTSLEEQECADKMPGGQYKACYRGYKCLPEFPDYTQSELKEELEKLNALK